MAFSTKRIYLSHDVAENFAPSGHGINTTPSSIGTESVREVTTVTVTASTDVNSNKVTAFDALIGTSAISAIDTIIAGTGATGFGIDTTGNTVSYNAKVLNVTRGVNGLPNDILLPAANDSFRITVDLSIALS